MAQLELPAPRCPQAQDGELDPDVLASVDVIIEPYTGMKLDQTIRVVWSDAGGTFFDDLMKVTKNNLDKQVTFTFEHAKWSNYLTVAADVYYQVIEDRQPTRVSAMLSLRRKERQLLLPDPVVEGAVNGTLRPVGDAVVTIPAEAQLKLGDEVELLWDGDAPKARRASPCTYWKIRHVSLSSLSMHGSYWPTSMPMYGSSTWCTASMAASRRPAPSRCGYSVRRCRCRYSCRRPPTTS
ncbi:hypothetical protein NWF32_30325 [Pseudomonas qingdaonensis]|nr:hypothetical protein [Pseudomonas qingdaonensis]